MLEFFLDKVALSPFYIERNVQYFKAIE